jgi:plastocyanin
MVAYTSIVVAATTFLGLTAAAPASIPTTGVVHRISVGSTTANGGLHYEPEIVTANIGDRILFTFSPKNHTMTQSSFNDPCQPLAGGKFSGYNYRVDAGESSNAFEFIVENTEPFWYYCSQPMGDHCKKGMSGVINQNFNSDKTLAAYKEKAKTAELKQASLDPLESRGGYIVPNVPL